MDENKKTSHWKLAIGITLAILFLYVFSLGPATWLMVNEYVSMGMYSAIYRPLGWIGQWCEPFARFLFWWKTVWLPQE